MAKLWTFLWSSPNNSSKLATFSRYSSTDILFGLGSIWTFFLVEVLGFGMKKVGGGQYDGFGGVSGGDGVTAGVFLFFLLGDTAWDSANEVGGFLKPLFGASVTPNTPSFTPSFFQRWMRWYHSA